MRYLEKYSTFPLWAICMLVLTIIVSGITIELRAQSLDSVQLQYTDAKGRVDINSAIDFYKQHVYNRPQDVFPAVQRLVKIAEKQKDPLPLAKTYQFMGSLYFQVKADYDSATYYLQKAEILYNALESTEATDGQAMVLHNFGTIKQVNGDYAEAIAYYLRALKLFDETGNMNIRPYTLNNISTLYALAHDNTKAEKYARECIELARKADNSFMEATGSIALADALMEQGRYEESLAPLQIARQYGEENDDPYKIFLYHLNYGSYLMEYKKDYAHAVKELEMAHELATTIGDEWEIMRHNSALSEAYLANKQYDDAYRAASHALAIAKKLQAKDKIDIALSILSHVDAIRGDFANAYQRLLVAYNVKDTLYDENNQQITAFLETTYQTEKKELQIESLQNQRKLYIWLGIASGLLLLTALILVIIRYRLAVSRRKLAEKESQRLAQEKQLVAVQATLDGEAAERSRLAKDLHDGLGSMLSVVKINLPDIKGGAVLEAIDVSRFQKALGLLDESIQELRRVAHHMMPESLLRYGLKTSLSDFCDAIPSVEFHYFGEEKRLPEKLEILVYRCVHELVNNALKHAQASQINVQLIQETNRISFTVQDNGIGFDQDSASEGMGLHNIRQRVSAFDGKLSIYSSDQGTEINVDIELKN